MFMITKQGKEVNYSDILLYSVNKKDIIVIVNDEEQMKKFSRTKKGTDAPIAVVPYTDEEITTIIETMKQIDNYNIIAETIEVVYEDGTIVKFDASNETVIKSNFAEQKKAKEKTKVVGSWANIPEEEKNAKKKENKKKLTRGLAASLAAIMVAGGLYSCKNGNFDKPKEVTGDMLNPTDPRKTEESVSTKSDFTKEAKALYKETAEVNPFILQYQQISNVKWNEELALEVVEFMNGVYPTSMTYMNAENAKAESVELMQAINLLIAGNLYAENKEEQMIDFSKYIANEKDRVLVHNAMVIARACIQESIGEPMNGKIIETDEEINKFSKEYTNSVDRLLHYEFETINHADFLTASAGTRFLVASIFQNINNTIPQWSYITRESSETDKREYDLYYRYFMDDYEKILYLPEPGQNGTNVYYAHWEDEESKCHKEGPYTEDVMHAMAGLSLLEEQRNLGIEANPNIRQLGIQTEVDNRVEDAMNEFFDLKYTYTNSK